MSALIVDNQPPGVYNVDMTNTSSHQNTAKAEKHAAQADHDQAQADAIDLILGLIDSDARLACLKNSYTSETLDRHAADASASADDQRDEAIRAGYVPA